MKRTHDIPEIRNKTLSKIFIVIATMDPRILQEPGRNYCDLYFFSIAIMVDSNTFCFFPVFFFSNKQY
jgi:hypothetical protein